MNCLGTNADGEPCELPAGWGCDSAVACRYHVEEVDAEYGQGAYGGGSYGPMVPAYGVGPYGAGLYGR